VGSCFLCCVSAPDRSVSFCSTLLFCFSVQFDLNIMNAYHAAPWSSSTSYDELYNSAPISDEVHAILKIVTNPSILSL
jgi:hypothetical protein